MKKVLKNKKGFTLIEMLVVVLIIGILAAIALPQYRFVIEKARFMEAITILRSIANAQDRFYMTNGRYANAYEMEKLDIEIQGDAILDGGVFQKRIETEFFVYAPDGDNNGTIENPSPSGYKAHAQRKPLRQICSIYIQRNGIMKCTRYEGMKKPAQKKICDLINQQGYL